MYLLQMKTPGYRGTAFTKGNSGYKRTRNKGTSDVTGFPVSFIQSHAEAIEDTGGNRGDRGRGESVYLKSYIIKGYQRGQLLCMYYE